MTVVGFLRVSGKFVSTHEPASSVVLVAQIWLVARARLVDATFAR